MEFQSEYFVSIRCMTYKHSAYIIDAMDGFVMQQTKFPFLAIIMDDASMDGEQDIIEKYLNDYFIISDNLCKKWETEEAKWVLAQHCDNSNCYFLVAFLKRNMYKQKLAKLDLIKVWEDKSKYIALCEGDDYWTDPLKLQKQVDIMEADETLMAVVTNSKLVDKEGKELKSKLENVVPDNKEGRYDLRSFMYKVHQYPTATICYRRTHTEEIEKMIRHTTNPYLGDWTMWISLHIFGDFYYLDQVTSAYRVNPTSVTHTCDRVGRAKANWTICKAVQDILPDEYDDIRKSLDNKSWMWIDLAFAYKHEHQYIRMLWCFFVAFVMDPKGLLQEYKKRKKK